MMNRSARHATLLGAATAIATTLGAMAVTSAVQADEIRGEVVRTFGDSLLLRTPDGQRLIDMAPGEGGAGFRVGDRVIADGDRDGDRLRDARVSLDRAAASSAAPSATDDPRLPESLRGLGLVDVDVREKSDGERDIRARFEGEAFKAEFDESGRIEEVETPPHAALPDALVTRILPEVARRHDLFAEFDRVHKIELDRDEIEIKGRDAAGGRIELELRPDGTLLEFKRKGRDHARDDRRPRVDIAPERVRDIAKEAGYGDIARIEAKPEHVEFDATNPHGERVRVFVDADGQVTKERRL